MMRSPIVVATAWIVVMAVADPGTATGAQWRSATPVTEPRPAKKRSPLLPLASALVPGSGQLLAGAKRGVLYMVAETVLLGWHFRSAAVGRRERNGYRDLAFRVARAPFMPTVRDTAFEYFEHMADFVASGPYDLDPGPALLPPSDGTTFNGGIWFLARRTFFADPDSPPAPDSEEYTQALQFYRARAVGPNFRWSWEGNLAAQEAFGRGIAASDDAFRRATILLGFVFANHLVSAVDAHVSQRLSSQRRTVRVHHHLDPAGMALGVTISF